jgi:hypothetical protein
MTNKDFTRNTFFLHYCKAVKLPPTTRQASKWRNKKGLAWKSFALTAKLG